MAQGKAEDTGGPTPPHLFDRRILPFFKYAGDTLPSLAERGEARKGAGMDMFMKSVRLTNLSSGDILNVSPNDI